MSHLDVANSEKSATSPGSSAPTRKIRSCFVCRQRKVRCDKQSPCGNCRRANIPCVLPSADRPPRWARRRELLANNAVAASQTVEPGDASLMERLRYLEDLVTDLSDQLQQARTVAASSGDSSANPSPGGAIQTYGELHESAAEVDNIRRQFGRMIVQDSGRTRYVTGFWSGLDDEVDGLDADGSPDNESDDSEDETLPGDSNVAKGHDLNTHQYSFLFQRTSASSSSSSHDFRPLPAQIPFLLEMFSENVYPLLCIVHMPSIKRMVHNMRESGAIELSTSDQALLYSIYYAAIVSMEEDETMTNFGESKADLSLRYRRGLEDALSRADFLNSPDLTLLQALAIFVFLARRHDSPRYVWMITALATRMAHYLGLHRDGAQFKHLTPFEVEIRRRVWWVVVLLDVRASEDQGTEITIKKGSFDTKLPLNVNDVDIDPTAEDAPTPRSGVTDVSFLRAASGNADIAIQVMAAKIDGDLAGCKEQNRLLNEVYAGYEREYLQHVPSTGNNVYWVAATAARVVLGKLTLLVYLPLLFSSVSEKGSEELRVKLLISAIEVAELNHALNEHSRRWRWIWQVHTHWYAFVYLLLETSRRPWSPIIERAWIALHSEWLFPQRSPTHRNMRIWIPLRKLMHRARRHRDAELHRLRTDPEAAAMLEVEDRQLPTPAKSGLYPNEPGEETYRQQWRNLISPKEQPQTFPSFHAPFTAPSTGSTGDIQGGGAMPELPRSTFTRSTYPRAMSAHTTGGEAGTTKHPSSGLDVEHSLVTTWSEPATIPTAYANDRNTWPDFTNWLWADTDLDPSLDMFSNVDMDIDLLDPNVDLDGDTNWYDWIESAKVTQ